MRNGDAPIQELDSVGGRLEPLARQLSYVLHDLKMQRAQVTEMQLSLRQQVVNRTNALERTIGSLRVQATLDALTRLANRRALDTHLPQAIDRCRERGVDLCLLMIDVDHFKNLNDTCGHPVGDQLLSSIGQIIRSTVRDGDGAFRYGGDEFAVVLESHTAESGRALADRLTSLVDALAGTLKVTPAPRLSIGVATLSRVTEPKADALLRSADQDLYDLKKSRKSVRLANPSPAATIPATQSPR